MVTMVLEAARDQVPVTIDGKKRKISKAQAAAINLANAAATGNPKFVLQFIDLIAGIEARAEAARPSAYPFSEVDKKVIHEIYKRLRPYDGQGDD
jgi:DNA polymerase IIIc chi subunit